MHHFFVSPDRVNEHDIIINGPDVNHIKNVLRMKAGEEILISNGQGQDYLCVISSIDEENVTASITDKSYSGTELKTRLWLFQALPKSDKMEFIIQKAVELGAYAIVPVKTSRCVVKLDEKKSQNKLKRWNAIAQSAAKQSRRSIIPEVMMPMDFIDALSYAKTFDMNIIPYENYKDMEQTVKTLGNIEEMNDIGIFIGPEGGFAEDEIEKAMALEVHPISLGRRILRTETAGMSILSVLMFRLEQ